MSYDCLVNMHYCVVKGCNNRSEKSSTVKFYSFPLKNKQLLQRWIRVIPLKCENVNIHTRICSEHFVEGTKGRDDVPSLFPNQLKQTGRKEIIKHTIATPRKWPKSITKVKHDHTYAAQCLPSSEEYASPVPTSVISGSYLTVTNCMDVMPRYSEVLDVATNTDNSTCNTSVSTEPVILHDVSTSTETTLLPKDTFTQTEDSISREVGVEANFYFSIEQISDKNNLIQFYTGFADFKTFKIAFTFLGEAVHCLHYWGNSNTSSDRIIDGRGAPRKLTPMNEFFLVLCRLRCGLLEVDIAHRFGVSQSTVSRILITWINFLYFKFKDLNIWPSKYQIQQYLPKQFKEKYPTTSCIIDATEVLFKCPLIPQHNN